MTVKRQNKRLTSIYDLVYIGTPKMFERKLPWRVSEPQPWHFYNRHNLQFPQRTPLPIIPRHLRFKRGSETSCVFSKMAAEHLTESAPDRSSPSNDVTVVVVFVFVSCLSGEDGGVLLRLSVRSLHKAKSRSSKPLHFMYRPVPPS